MSIATDHVRRTGRIFRCGTYEDKDFSLTPDEARAAIAAFEPVPVDLEHTSTVLDNRLGTLESVAMDADGESLIGTVALPAWLDSLLDEGQRKVSATWDRATKTLKGLAIVNTPRVEDAVLMAAFAATDEGKRLVSVESEFAGRRHSQADQDALQAVHDHSVTLGAACPSDARMSKETGMTEQKAPTRMERFMAWIAGEGDDEPKFAAAQPKQAAAAPPDEPTEREKALMARVAAMERDAITKAAAAFADAEVAAFRALPAEREALVASYIDAAEDDRTAPRTVTFAVGEETKTGTRVDALMARHAARTPHTLTSEQLRDGHKLPMSRADSGDTKVRPERKAHLAKLAGYTLEANGN